LGVLVNHSATGGLDSGLMVERGKINRFTCAPLA